MSCYNPLKGFPVGLTATGHTKYMIVPYEVDAIYCNDEGKKIPIKKSDIRYRQSSRLITEFILVPCGKCVGCRLDYSREWANRLMMERMYHESAYFVTLTYNDEHLPFHYDEDSGFINGPPTLCKRDLQNWMKRLRKAVDYPVRYFAAGEYGEHGARPHYHVIVFGLVLNDLVLYKRTPEGNCLYTSEFLQSTWSLDGRPIGFATIGEVTYESCAYTARYVMKKHKGPDSFFYVENHLDPEFTLMSRKPGIGRQYFEDHPDLYDYEYINISTESGGLKFKPPRYFDRIRGSDDEAWKRMRSEQKKQAALNSTRLKLSRTSLDFEEQLDVEEQHKLKSIKSLERRLT